MNKRCARCILPSNYPGIQFNVNGICNHCIEHKEIRYLGEKAFLLKIRYYVRKKKDVNNFVRALPFLAHDRGEEFHLIVQDDLTGIVNISCRIGMAGG